MHDKNGIRVEEAVKLYSDTVLKIAYTYTKNVYDAEDIAQEVFLALCTNIWKLKSDEHIKAWLIRVTMNKAKNYMRSNWISKRSEMPNNEKNLCDGDRNGNALLDAVLSLDEKYRIPIHLLYYEGFSIKEIAKILRIKPATVGTRLKRGRERLRCLLEGGDDFV